VARGAVEVSIAQQPAGSLTEGDTIFFSASLPHVIANCTDAESILYLLAAPQRNGRT
jgi:hypothetical protein